MADKPFDERPIPAREIRPRGSERSELNAQRRDKFLASDEAKDMIEGAKRALGFSHGGAVHRVDHKSKMMSCRKC